MFFLRRISITFVFLCERVVKVKAPVVKVAHFETIEKHFNVIVKKPLKLFVIPKLNLLKAPKVENFSRHQTRSVECKVEKSCRVFIKEKDETFVRIYRENVLSAFNETLIIKPSIHKSSSKPVCLTEVVTSVKENCTCKLSNFADGYEYCLQVMNTAIVPGVSKVNISFLCLKFQPTF